MHMAYHLLPSIYGISVMAMMLRFRPRDLSPGRRLAAAAYVAAVAAFNLLAILVMGNADYARIYLLLVQLPVYVGFYIFSRYKGVKLLFVMLSVIVFTTPPIVIATSLRTFYGIGAAMLTVTLAGSFLLMALFIYRFLIPDFNYILENCESRHFWMFCIIPMLDYVYSFARTGYNFMQPFETSGYWLRQIPTLIVFASYILLVRVFRITRENQQLESESTMMRMQLDSAKLYLEELKTTQEQAKIYRHDMRHHLSLLGGYAAEGNLEKIKEYLTSAEEEIRSFTPTVYCVNETANLILNAFETHAAKVGVTMTINVKLPEELSLSDAELCSLFSNAIENAITAAAQVEELGLRKVYVLALINGDRLAIATENAYAGTIEMDGELPKSKRAESGHGLGVKSMTTIVERRGGVFSIDTSDNIFVLRMVVPI